MTDVKAFFIGTLKVAVAIVFSIIALSLLGWAGYAIYQKYEANQNEPLATPRIWPEREILADGSAKTTLRTIWRDGKMHYHFQIKGYPKEIENARASPTQNKLFKLLFYDKNEFLLFEQKIELSEMLALMGKDGSKAGLEIHGEKYIAPETYRLAAIGNVSWHF